MQNAMSLTPIQLRSTTQMSSNPKRKQQKKRRKETLTRMQVPQLGQPHRPRTNMHMRGLVRTDTHINVLHPRMRHHFINRGPQPWIWL